MTGLEIRRHIPATRAHVWAMLTEPETLAAWFWPASLGATVKAEARPGGGYRIASVTTGMAVSGRYTDVTPPERLGFTWHWDGETAATEVLIELSSDDDGGCLLTLTHRGFADERARDDHVQGWNDCLDRLPDASGGPT